MRVDDLDAFALKTYSFSLRKTNTHFTLPTICLSIAIVTAAIMLNIDTVSHLWLTRQQLPILQSQGLSYSGPLTSTLVCYRPNSIINALPKARIYDQSNNELSFPLISQEKIETIRPNLAAKIGTTFGCFNLEGFSFNQGNISLRIEVEDTNSSLFFQALTEEEVIEQKDPLLFEMTSTSISNYGQLLSLIHFVIRDTLMVNSDPQEIITFYYQNIDPPRVVVHDTPINYTYFYLTLRIPKNQININDFNINYRQLTITRYDLGFILGTVLSWISFFTLIFSFIAVPLLEKELELLQIVSFFHIPQEYQDPSLLKYVVASYKSGLFPKQDAFVELAERLEPMKDICSSLKLQKALRNLCPAVPASVEKEVIASEDNFNQHSNEKYQPLLYTDQNDKQSGSFDAGEDALKESFVIRARKALLKWLDSGSDTISVVFQRNGFGSKVSIVLTIIVAVGFIAFLIIFKILNISSTTVIYDLMSDDVITYQFQPNQIMLASLESAVILVSLIDQNYKIISNLTLTSSSKCLQNLTTLQLSQLQSYPYYYCFQDPITLIQSSNQVVSLNINNINFQFGDLTVFHFSQLISTADYHPVDTPVSISSLWGNPAYEYYEEAFTLTTIVEQDIVSTTYAHLTPLKAIGNGLSQLVGMNIKLPDKITFIQTTSDSIFDVMQNVWGFALMCFTVLLMKVTKYINNSERESRITTIRADFRDNLGVLLSKLSTLKSGRYREELSKMKHYLKHPISPQIHSRQ